MRRAAIGTLAFILIVVSGGISFAGSEHREAATLLTPTLNLGSISADSPMGVVSSASLIIRTEAPWTLSVQRTSAELAPGDSYSQELDAVVSEELTVQMPDGSWNSLVPGLPLHVASGLPTDDAGSMLTVELRVTPSFSFLAGKRECRLQFSLNERPIGGHCRFSYVVLPLTKVIGELVSFDSPTVDPTTPALYRFAARSYTVLSNVPWVLEASLKEQPRVEGTDHTLGADALAVICESGEIKPMPASEHGIVIASGGPTGRAGRSTDVLLAVQITGWEAGGRYRAELEIKASPVPSLTLLSRAKD